ncbi:unnamed protein product [Peronospora effusa]|nr:unnamed protein product [Peronospora effusa]
MVGSGRLKFMAYRTLTMTATPTTGARFPAKDGGTGASESGAGADQEHNFDGVLAEEARQRATLEAHVRSRLAQQEEWLQQQEEWLQQLEGDFGSSHDPKHDQDFGRKDLKAVDSKLAALERRCEESRECHKRLARLLPDATNVSIGRFEPKLSPTRPKEFAKAVIELNNKLEHHRLNRRFNLYRGRYFHRKGAIDYYDDYCDRVESCTQIKELILENRNGGALTLDERIKEFAHTYFVVFERKQRS